MNLTQHSPNCLHWEGRKWNSVNQFLETQGDLKRPKETKRDPQKPKDFKRDQKIPRRHKGTQRDRRLPKKTQGFTKKYSWVMKLRVPLPVWKPYIWYDWRDYNVVTAGLVTRKGWAFPDTATAGSLSGRLWFDICVRSEETSNTIKLYKWCISIGKNGSSKGVDQAEPISTGLQDIKLLS